MLINISETYLEVLQDGSRRVGGDFPSAYMASALGTPAYYCSQIAGDDNGHWLGEEIKRLYKGGILIGRCEKAKTIVATHFNKGISYNHNEASYLVSLKEGVERAYKNAENVIVSFSASLLRNDEAFEEMKSLLNLKKKKKGARFAMDFRMNEALYGQSAELVLERFKELWLSLDIVLLGNKELNLLSSGNSLRHKLANLPFVQEKMVFICQDGVNGHIGLFQGDDVLETPVMDPDNRLSSKRDAFYAGLLAYAVVVPEVTPESCFGMVYLAASLSALTSDRDYLTFPDPEELAQKILVNKPVEETTYEA